LERVVDFVELHIVQGLAAAAARSVWHPIGETSSSSVTASGSALAAASALRARQSAHKCTRGTAGAKKGHLQS
jgi:hypothetical protein